MVRRKAFWEIGWLERTVQGVKRSLFRVARRGSGLWLWWMVMARVVRVSRVRR